jgi:FkbM family methyltransferase
LLKIYPEREYPDAAKFCKLFFYEKTRPRYVLGRNEYAVSIAQCIDINGFIDDYTCETEFLEKPILKMSEIPKESLVVSAVIFVMPLTAIRRLQDYGIYCLDYFNFFKYSGLSLKEIDFLRESKEDIGKNFQKYQSIYNSLVDEKSKNVLGNLLNFRVSSDLSYMLEFENLQHKQYFEDFLELKRGEVFVDAGGFDGQTSIEFIKRCPDYKTIYLFEPDSTNVAIARNRLSQFDNIYFYEIGLGENVNKLRFNSGVGSASKFSKTGDIEVEVDSIDNMIKDTISLIKMDIEGAESIAIEGAKTHIIKDHPKLAICCYHRVKDLWMIPEQIMAMRNDYSIYLRHYTNGLHETVMFFIPVA